MAGWSYQWITQLDWAADSWTAPLDTARLPPGTDATTATLDQVRRLVGLLPADAGVPVFVFDAVFYPDPAPREPGSRGRPRLATST